jgi:ribosomal protein L32E
MLHNRKIVIPWRRNVYPSSGVRVGSAAQKWATPKDVRGLHPQGLREVLLKNAKDLLKIDPQKNVVRIASNVGGKKREQILKKANELRVTVLNPGGGRHETGLKEKAGG